MRAAQRRFTGSLSPSRGRQQNAQVQGGPTTSSCHPSELNVATFHGSRWGRHSCFRLAFFANCLKADLLAELIPHAFVGLPVGCSLVRRSLGRELDTSARLEHFTAEVGVPHEATARTRCVGRGSG